MPSQSRHIKKFEKGQGYDMRVAKTIVLFIQKEAVKKMSKKYRIFWKIIVNAYGGKIQAYKEVSLWDISNKNGLCQEQWLRKPLQVEICIPEEDENDFRQVPESLRNVFVNADQIIFDGGFLRITDDGLKNDLYEFEKEIPNFDASRDVENIASHVETLIGNPSNVAGFLIEFIKIKLNVLFNQEQLDGKRCEAVNALQTLVELNVCEWLNKLFDIIASVIESESESLITGRCSDFLESFDAQFLNANLVLQQALLENISPEIFDLILEVVGDGSMQMVSEEARLEFIESFGRLLEGCFPANDGTVEEVNKHLYFKGENIRLEVEFETNDPNSENVAPLFCYAQGVGRDSDEHFDNGRITLKEIKGGQNGRTATVEISNNDLKSETDYRIKGSRVLTFFEDKDREGVKNPYFELLVDAIPLKLTSDPLKAIHEHWFDTQRKVFYVGYIPSPSEVALSKDTFHGGLRRLVFDPNASCPGCVGGV